MKVLFTQLKPSILQYKLAKALKKKGHRTLLLTLLNQFNHEEYSTAFDEIITLDLNNLKPKTILLKACHDTKKFVRFFYRLAKLKPDIAICEGAPHYLAALFIRFFKGRCKRIYFPYDLNYTRLINPRDYFPLRETWGEKYCLKNCDAIFFKSADGELDLLPKSFGVKGKESLCIPHYTLSDWYAYPSLKDKISKRAKKINIVYTGMFVNNVIFYGSMISDFRVILEQNMELHIYIAHGQLSQNERKMLTGENERLNKNLFVHAFVSPEKLSEEIKKYDYGLYFPRFSDYALKDAVKFAAGNKVSSYLEAGIPLIVNAENKAVSKTVEENNLGVSLSSLDNLKKELYKKDYNQLAKNVLKFREYYSMDKKIDGIIAFLNRVIGKNKKLRLR